MLKKEKIMQFVSLKECEALDNAQFAHRKLFYAVVDKNYHWRVVEKHGAKYIQWIKAQSCEGPVKHENAGREGVSVFKTKSHVYMVLRLKEARPAFVRLPSLRYKFERKIATKLSLIQAAAAAAALVAGTSALALARRAFNQKKHEIEQLKEQLKPGSLEKDKLTSKIADLEQKLQQEKNTFQVKIDTLTQEKNKLQVKGGDPALMQKLANRVKLLSEIEDDAKKKIEDLEREIEDQKAQLSTAAIQKGVEEKENLKRELDTVKSRLHTTTNLAAKKEEEEEQLQSRQRAFAKQRALDQQTCLTSMQQHKQNLTHHKDALIVAYTTSPVNETIKKIADQLIQKLTDLIEGMDSCVKDYPGKCLHIDFCESIEKINKNVLLRKSDLLNAVQVYIRISPHEYDKTNLSIVNAASASSDKCLKLSNDKTYKDMIFYDTTFETNKQVFQGSLKEETVINSIGESITKVSEGYSQVILAFGVSGSGKTFTLFGGDNTTKTPGIYHLATARLKYLQAKLEIATFEEYVSDAGQAIVLTNSFQIADTLEKAGVKTTIDDFEDKKFNIKNITNHRVDKERIKPTPNNQESSRSHLYIVIKCTFPSKVVGYLTIVDMAGLEDSHDIYTKLIQLKEEDSDISSYKRTQKGETYTNTKQLFGAINSSTMCLNGEYNKPWNYYFEKFPESAAVESYENVLKSENNKAVLLDDYITKIGKKSGHSGCPKINLHKLISLDTKKKQAKWLHDLLVEGVYINKSLVEMQRYAKNQEMDANTTTTRILKALNLLADRSGQKPTRFTFLFMLKTGTSFLEANIKTMDLARSFLPGQTDSPEE
jgi:hypothetical protein